MTAVPDFKACALGGLVADENHTLDWLFDVLHDAGHTTRGVATSIKREGRACCDRAVLEKTPQR